MVPFRVFIGYDTSEETAFQVLARSIWRRATIPIAIAPIARAHYPDLYTRERTPQESTEFSITRFLTPYLSGYQGWALFLDCDMLCQGDIAELLEYTERDDYAVLVCQHDYIPATLTKFEGRPQLAYPRKNWSSVMLLNTAKCKTLTPLAVNTADPVWLHRLLWTSDAEIGALPMDWNWLVGEYPVHMNAKLLHYTLGGPWHANQEYLPEHGRWLEARFGD
jgi:hypothetical protein